MNKITERQHHRFRKELEELINAHSLENGSDTPDFILAAYLTNCLASFDRTMQLRDAWYSNPPGGQPIDVDHDR